jgi:hypothetical protein
MMRQCVGVALFVLVLISSPQASSNQASSNQASPQDTTTERAMQELVTNLKGFHVRTEPSGPYPGYKICRIMQRSIEKYFLGGHSEKTLSLTYASSTGNTRKAISNASQNAWLRIKSDWNQDVQNRPEYFRNELVPYGFQALELLVPGTIRARIFIGVTDNHKNKSGLSAICILGFEVPSSP